MKNTFFHALSIQEFVDLLQTFTPLETEMVTLDQAEGRVLAQDIQAREDLPLVDRSCMDGYAVRAADLFGAGENSPAYLDLTKTLQIKEIAEEPLRPGTCMAITTGGTLPQGADAVIMVEHTEKLDDTTIEIRKALSPGENVMLRGEDVSVDARALEAGLMIRPQEAGLLAALGEIDVPVHCRPRVAILSTGDELVALTDKPLPGQVRDVNSVTIAALVGRHGGLPVSMGIIRDNVDELSQAMDKALQECDLVCLSGGSSVGTRDLTVEVIEKRPDSKILAHGVSISPGKPTILARCGNKPVLGLPGQVTSAQVVMLVLGGPLIRHLQGWRQAFDPGLRPVRQAVLTRNLASKQGREDYVRVALQTDKDNEQVQARPLSGKSGLLRTLLDADGLIRVPASSEGLPAGTLVDVWLI